MHMSIVRNDLRGALLAVVVSLQNILWNVKQQTERIAVVGDS